ncbi:MAG: hypothetical protein UT37_C0004G0013 [Parcubacteria group bacterium GW2011_GWA2_39_18]|nr:MAG: hypothetical protein UT37_C0004G0013 [Parcubacteria group bacterium GW2011_GWA2_39_18]
MPNESKKVLLFDFGMGDARAALVEKNKTGTNFLAFSQENFVLEQKELILKDSADVCAKLKDDLYKKLGQKAEEVVVGLPPSFVECVSLSERFKRDDPDKKITKEETKEIEKNLVSLAYKKIVSSKELKEKNLDCLYTNFNYYNINGYQIDSILNKTGSEVEIGALVNFISKSDHDFLNHILIKNLFLPIKKILFSPLELSLLYKFKNPQFSAIIMYIAQKSSALVLTQKGAVSHVETLPEGLEQILGERSGNAFEKQLEIYLKKINTFGSVPKEILLAGLSAQNSVKEILTHRTLPENLNFGALDLQNLKLDPEKYKCFGEKNIVEKNLSIIALGENLINYGI